MTRLEWLAGAGLGLLALPSMAFAGAWTLPEGKGQVIVTTTTSSADREFKPAGLAPTPRYRKFEASMLFEYGVTDKFTFVAVPGLQRVDIASPVDATRSGLGYTEFGGRYRLFQNESWVVSAQGTMRVPGTRDTVNPAAIGYTGVETDMRLLVGRSFMLGTMPAFADAQFAQRMRSVGPNEFRADFTLGAQLAPSFQLLLQSFNVISEGAVPPLFPSYAYHKFQMSGVYAITPALALQLGGFTTYSGRNALQESGVVVGMGYKF